MNLQRHFFCYCHIAVVHSRRVELPQQAKWIFSSGFLGFYDSFGPPQQPSFLQCSPIKVQQLYFVWVLKATAALSITIIIILMEVLLASILNGRDINSYFKLCLYTHNTSEKITTSNRYLIIYLSQLQTSQYAPSSTTFSTNYFKLNTLNAEYM